MRKNASSRGGDDDDEGDGDADEAKGSAEELEVRKKMRAALPSASVPQVMEVLDRFKNDANFVKDSMSRMQARCNRV